RWLGPGVADAKGGLVVLTAALEALESHPAAETVGWRVMLNPDEELGSPSSAERLVELATGCRAGLLFEPSLPGGVLVAGRGGSGNFWLTVAGRSAHAGRDPEMGRNAIEALARLIGEVAELNAPKRGVTVNVGRIIGGGPLNRVPATAVAGVNFRVRDAAAQAWVERELAARVHAADGRDGCAVTCYGRFQAPARPVDPAMERLMKEAESTAADLGVSIDWADTGGVCDGNRVAAAGVPVIDTLGVVGGDLHSDQEWADPTSVASRAALTALLALRLGRVHN
ncbi:MAG: M20/M25/M40 family metallo-hydrolase, partial [Phycisphaeraceae bacterium]|nr:M20/M25/M40 family metallo-hydrolase [Phycisphaeraceae bacterium]